jgi:hypothetical protein
MSRCRKRRKRPVSFMPNLLNPSGTSQSKKRPKGLLLEAGSYSQGPQRAAQVCESHPNTQAKHVLAMPSAHAERWLHDFSSCHAGPSGQKKPGKYVPSFLPPALAASMSAQSNLHSGAAAAAAAISSRLGGVSKLGRALVILQQPEHCGALIFGP